MDVVGSGLEDVDVANWKGCWCGVRGSKGDRLRIRGSKEMFFDMKARFAEQPAYMMRALRCTKVDLTCLF